MKNAVTKFSFYFLTLLFSGSCFAATHIAEFSDSQGGVNINVPTQGIYFFDTTNIESPNITLESSSRITVKTTGYYQITYSLNWETPDNRRKQIRTQLQRNGYEIIVPSISYGYARHERQAGKVTNSATVYVELLEDDYVELVYERSTNITQPANSLANEVRISIEYIAPLEGVISGPAGSQGEVGPQGSVGLTGPQGEIGPQGPVGLTGPQGEIGPQGPVGLTGPQGPIGLTGPQGPIGATGPQGEKGDPGTGPINVSCPTDEVVSGFDSTGGLVCVKKPLANVSAYDPDYIGDLLIWTKATGVPFAVSDGEWSIASNVVQVEYASSVAGPYALYLRDDGTLGSRGLNNPNANPTYHYPPGLSNLTKIAYGGGHSIALKEDGTVVTWDYNKLLLPSVDLTNVVDVAAGEDFFIAVKSDGTVLAWGFLGEPQHLLVPENLTDVVQVSANYHNVVALKSDGSAVAFGSNHAGQNDVPEGLSNIKQVLISAGVVFALKNDGHLVTWGSQANKYDARDIPSDLEFIDASGATLVGLRSNGGLVVIDVSNNYPIYTQPITTSIKKVFVLDSNRIAAIQEPLPES